MNKKDLYILELESMKGFSELFVENPYLINYNKKLKSNFEIQIKWLKELIVLFKKNKIIIKK